MKWCSFAWKRRKNNKGDVLIMIWNHSLEWTQWNGRGQIDRRRRMKRRPPRRGFAARLDNVFGFCSWAYKKERPGVVPLPSIVFSFLLLTSARPAILVEDEDIELARHDTPKPLLSPPLFCFVVKHENPVFVESRAVWDVLSWCLPRSPVKRFCWPAGLMKQKIPCVCLLEKETWGVNRVSRVGIQTHTAHLYLIKIYFRKRDKNISQELRTKSRPAAMAVHLSIQQPLIPNS